VTSSTQMVSHSVSQQKGSLGQTQPSIAGSPQPAMKVSMQHAPPLPPLAELDAATTLPPQLPQPSESTSPTQAESHAVWQQ